MELIVTEMERDMILVALRDLIKQAEGNRSFVVSKKKKAEWDTRAQVTRDLFGRLFGDKCTERFPIPSVSSISRSDPHAVKRR